MMLPEPQSKTFTSIISEIETGQIKIPQFQTIAICRELKKRNISQAIDDSQLMELPSEQEEANVEEE